MDGTNRHRNRNTISGFIPASVRGHCANPAILGSTSLLKVEEMWDVEDPDFRNKRYNWIRYGIPLPVNNMRILKESFDEHPYMDVVACHGCSAPCATQPTFDTWWKGPLSISGSFFGITTHGGLPVVRPRWGTDAFWGQTSYQEFSESERNALMQKALAKARTASWDVGTFLAEFRKTARMFRNVGRGVVDRTERILSKRSVKTLDDFFSAWLEYRYGWRILAYDILEANESLLRLRGLNPLHSRYTAFDKKVVEHSASRTGQRAAIRMGTDIYATPYRPDILFVDSKEVSIRAGVGLTLNADKLAFADPLVTVSEIIPYHLVLNWFVNSKELVEAWSPFAHGQVAYGFLTETKTQTRTMYLSNHRFTTSGVGSGKSHFHALNVQGGKISRVDVQRTARQPVMNLRFRLNFKTANILDAIGIVLLSRQKVFKNLRAR